MQLVPRRTMLTGYIDVDSVVATLITCMVQAAKQTTEVLCLKSASAL